MDYRVIALGIFAACSSLLQAQQPGRFELKPGEHVAILGNTLPDRMQHSGYFETLIHQKHPGDNLVFRNLSAAGDEVATWQRSENFGSRDQWLEKVQADVVFAFYGFNESFKGYDGLEKFKADLDKFLKDMRAKNYSGKGAPRVVLFGPTADEKHQDANFQDPAPNNERLRDYTEAMGKAAAANGVPFVELFKASQQIFSDAAKKKQSLTVNGHYLTPEGDRQLAPVMFQSLFGERPPALNEKLRAAVNEKNRQWHQRYRTMDGYNVYGGRSALAYQPGKGGFLQNTRNPETTSSGTPTRGPASNPLNAAITKAPRMKRQPAGSIRIRSCPAYCRTRQK